jgi:hypothetical protein
MFNSPHRERYCTVYLYCTVFTSDYNFTGVALPHIQFSYRYLYRTQLRCCSMVLYTVYRILDNIQTIRLVCTNFVRSLSTYCTIPVDATYSIDLRSEHIITRRNCYCKLKIVLVHSNK